MNFSGKLTYKVVMKNDYVRNDGTCALYVQVFLNKTMKRFPLNIACLPAAFDKKKQRIKSGSLYAHDYNLIIEKFLSDINKIEVSHRLSNRPLSMANLIKEITNPTANMDFLSFWEQALKSDSGIKPSTRRQQTSVLTKLKQYRENIYFHEITDNFIKDMKAYFVNVKKNEPTTIASLIKTFKKMLHLANKQGIVTPILYSDIKSMSFRGSRTFLMPDEINALYRYWKNEFINATHKAILARFLFSCFTSLRISDNLALTEENFLGDFIAFTSVKTGKFQRIALNNSAKEFLDENNCLVGKFTPEYINRELKFIMKAVGIRKNVSFHVARHSFATNYLMSGGRVEHLQKILGHFKIEETMIYVHIVESITDIQIKNMDEILKINAQ